MTKIVVKKMEFGVYDSLLEITQDHFFNPHGNGLEIIELGLGPNLHKIAQSEEYCPSPIRKPPISLTSDVGAQHWVK